MTDPKEPEVPNPDELSDDDIRQLIIYDGIPKDKDGNYTDDPVLNPETLPQPLVDAWRAEMTVTKAMDIKAKRDQQEELSQADKEFFEKRKKDS